MILLSKQNIFATKLYPSPMTSSALLKSKAIHYQTSLGDVYFFDNFFISEFKEGIDINFEKFHEIALLVNAHFEEKPFGFISNRINSYSIFINDADLFHKSYPNLKAYGIVVYKTLTKKVIEIENRFFKFNRQTFMDLNLAVEWVEQVLSNKNL